MRQRRPFHVLLVGAAAIALALTSQAPVGATPPADSGEAIDAYRAIVTSDQRAELARLGHDLTEQQAGEAVDLFLTRGQAKALEQRGINLALTRVKGGKTVREFAAEQAQGGYTVYRSWDEDGGIEDEMRALAKANPQSTKLVSLGTTHQGRDILALKVTAAARDTADGSRPAVLFNSTQHAREWISTEVNRRLMHHYVYGWRTNDKAIKKVLQSTELWFVPVANPDGYQRTFESPATRLWRKNTRDNDNNGVITSADGVDPNRNYPNHWGYDNEGSSDIPSSETYRGPSEASEPETQALKGLIDSVGFAFHVNWHSNGQWLLYGEGWQVGNASPDDPIYYAMSGNLDEPAIEDFHPGIGSDVLYITNGDTNDYSYGETGAIAWVPELSAGCDGCGFVFPDDEELIQAEFLRNLPFAKSVAASAVDPANPKTVTGRTTKPFYIDSEDPYKGGIPGAHLSFKYSYGDPQPVAVNAKRSLGAVTVKWRINGGAVQSGPTTEWTGGEKFSPAAVHYRQMRGVVTGTDPGDSVQVWFEGGGATSESFTYEAVSESGDRVLVVAAEDYTGASPAQTPGPHYADYYTDALDANGVSWDLYDVDARGRTAPDNIGVLSHYDAVVWYTGDDIVTRQLGRGPGNADRLAMDEILEMRSYLNEGGKVLYTGNRAGEQFTGATVGTQRYDPKREVACNPLPAGVDPRRCLSLRGSGDNVNDVMQYWFGGYSQIGHDGIDPETGTPFGSTGVGEPFAGLTWDFGGADSADNQNETSSFVATSGVLAKGAYPQFDSWPASRWARPGGPYSPHSGSKYFYSQMADVSYKRLTKEIAVPADGGTLSFWTSFDTEQDWDYVMVEARTAGGSDWTTLPDVNGHTSTSTGESCTSDWISRLHPHLAHYQTLSGGVCSPTGTTGSWNAASGNSGGWQEWEVDLAAYAGKTVEISIAYASDWSTQQLGSFVDDVTYPDGSTEDFESGLGGWVIAGPPAGSGDNGNNFIHTDAAGFPVGNTIATPDTLLFGFGLEGVATSAERNAIMDRALDHLLD